MIDLATDPDMADDLYDFLSTEIDSTSIDKPNAYMTYIYYDDNFKIIPDASKVIQVQDPNELGTLADMEVEAPVNGFLHAYVSNGSSHAVDFDNFMITYTRGNTRQFNEYYPYGLSNTGINGYSNEYPYKYQGKEYQSGEWDAANNGWEMYDFDARFYEPALGRWFVPDPAEQFHNPYLAMGNNPVIYGDPNGLYAEPFFRPDHDESANAPPSLGSFSNGVDGHAGGAFNVGGSNGSGGGGGYFPSNSPFSGSNYWVNSLGAQNGSFAHNFPRYGYFRDFTITKGVEITLLIFNGDERLVAMPITETISEWVSLKDDEFDWGNANNPSQIDFAASTDVQNIQHILYSMRSASQNGADYIDIREIFRNFPPYLPDASLDLAGITNILGSRIPVHVNLAVYDNMRIGLYDVGMDQNYFHGKNINGIVKNGKWVVNRFSRYNGNIPMMSIHFQSSDPKILFNYLFR